jgi:hypothetical protein
VLPAGPLPLTTNASTSLPAALRDGRTSGRARTLPFMAALGSALFFCESNRASLMAITHQSAYWKKRAALWLRLHSLCVGCKAIGRTIVATMCDHVVPISAGGSWQGEVQSVCRECHDVVKRELERRFKAGKATADDLRLDSPMAQELARKLYTRTGLDGWPILDLQP